MMHHALGENTDINRIGVTDNRGVSATVGTSTGECVHAQFCHLITTQRLRNEAVHSRTDIRISLRPVDAKDPRGLVYFELDRVGRNDLDIGRDNFGASIAGGDAMPGVSSKVFWFHEVMG
jgi:hypothetical protein